MSHIRPNESNYYSDREKWKIHDLTLEKTKKSNVIGESIDLIAELIIWGAKHNWMYDDTMNNICNKIDENNMTQLEKENKKRNNALRLLAQIQDMNSGARATSLAFSIILNIFPELKNYFGSNIIMDNNQDVLIANAEHITLDNTKRKYKTIELTIQSELHNFWLALDAIIDYLKLNNILQIEINNTQINEKKINELQEKVEKNNTSIIKKVLLLLETNDINNQETRSSIMKLLSDNKKITEPLFLGIQESTNKYKDLFDIMTSYYQRFPDLHKIVEIVTKFKKRINTNTEKLSRKLSSFDDYDNYISQNYRKHSTNWNSNNTSNSNKEYLISKSDEQINPFKYFPGSGIYELIGIQLSNTGHAISFVKTGKSDSSWSGIDSNRNANDDNYKLEDIIYKDNNLIKNNNDSQQQSTTNNEYNELSNENMINKNYYNDNTNNTFLAKVYKHYGYRPVFLLWKKVTLKSEQSKTIEILIDKIKKDYNLLHKCFQNWQNEHTETYSKELINIWFKLNDDLRSMQDLYRKLYNYISKSEREFIKITMNNISQDNFQINEFMNGIMNYFFQQQTINQQNINNNQQNINHNTSNQKQ